MNTVACNTAIHGLLVSLLTRISERGVIAMKSDSAYLERIFASLSLLQTMLRDGYSEATPAEDDDFVSAWKPSLAEQIANSGPPS